MDHSKIARSPFNVDSDPFLVSKYVQKVLQINMRVKEHGLTILSSFLATTAHKCSVNLKQGARRSNNIAVALVVTVRTHKAIHQQIIKCLDSNGEDHAGSGYESNERNRHNDLWMKPSCVPLTWPVGGTNSVHYSVEVPHDPICNFKF
jgi:hypothetical protein